ncbi:metallophosphoesterase [Ensifer sp. ENS12]|uniref:metallophosphoesterase family protein n=1 Tax=Ensifer sp. ENS12 TaxID=2854774 RepID=UPI001C45EEC2|nr:metallophosphoesterase [Ensifer sp. ENS12]MBV7518467.1 metallophosphoesterase [Ensifer sp. ENS12]
MKIVQISDTHLSPSKSHFNNNWEPVRAWIEEMAPDLVIHTGDLTIDGADREDDITFSLGLINRLSMPVLVVPGNHDVGHLPGSHQPVDPERLARWRGLAGPDYWVSDHGDWRLVGFNSLLVGFEDEEEEKQIAWLEEQLRDRDGRKVAVFAHKPLFVDGPQEGDTGYWGIRPRQRRRLFDLFAASGVALHASGHLHWAWTGEHAGMSLVWAPPTSFIIDTLERPMPGERLVGAVVHTFSEAGVVSEIVAVPGLVSHVLDPIVEEVYPLAAKKKLKVEAAQ